MYVVSDEILERLLCSECKKYLSVKPVKVYPNRSTRCGRCSNPFDAGINSLFGVLAEEALFRCVNRYDGCSELLTYSEVADHEKLCTGNEYDCMACSEPFKGTSYDLYVHFKEKHEDALLMNNPEFTVVIENELYKTYLYCKNDLLFFINVQYNRSDQELILNISHLGSDLQSSFITQNFTLYSADRKVKHQSKTKSCCSVSEGNLKSFRVSISENDFQQNIVICRFHLNTENVEQLIALPEELKKSGSHTQVDLDTGPVDNVFSQPIEYYPLNPTESRHMKYPVRLKSGANFSPGPDYAKYPIANTSNLSPFGKALATQQASTKDPVVKSSPSASLAFTTSGFNFNASHSPLFGNVSDARLGSAKDPVIKVSSSASPALTTPIFGRKLIRRIRPPTSCLTSKLMKNDTEK